MYVIYDRMDDLEKTCAVIIVLAAALLIGTGKPRRWWVRPWIGARDNRSNLNLINAEFDECNDLGSFKNFLRMDRKTYETLLKMIEKDIDVQNTHLRQSISAADRLTITLRFLATGESFQSLHYTFRVGQSTISGFVPQVCKAIYTHLRKDYLKMPNTTEEWLNISEEFNRKWNLPNVLGAMDGKHIVFRAPRNAGSTYYNYKQQHSIVLLAVVDSDYKFLYVDVGTNGRISDGGVFQRSALFRALSTNALNFPAERPLPGRRKNIPFVVVADAAFPLSLNIMKPYPFRNMTWSQRVFNYRLSRCRRVENAFGILTNKWRVLLHTLDLSPDKVELITLTCCALHNYVRANCPLLCEAQEDAGVDRRFIFRYGLRQQTGNRAGREALSIRNEFTEYVVNEGQVPWQNNLA